MTAMTTLDDQTLLRRYERMRDAAAFSELARRYAGFVLGVAQRITGSAHDAEDITQSCFFELARHAGSIRSIPGYLHRVVTTRALNLRRDQRVRREHESQAAKSAPDAGDRELLEQIDAAVDTLPDDLRIPLLLHYQQHLTQTEVSISVGISQATVSRRLELAVERLRLILQKTDDAHGAWSAAVLTGVLSKTAAVPPHAALLASLNKVGLAGVGKPATALVSAALVAKIALAVAVVVCGGVALSFFRRGPAAPVPTVANTPVSLPAEAPAAPSPLVAAYPLLSIPQAATWQTPDKIATCVALSPDGRLAISASSPVQGNRPVGMDSRTSLILWDTGSGKQVRTFTGHTRYIGAVVFAPDGKTFASASRDGTVRVWDVETGRQLHVFRVDHCWFKAVAFSLDGRQLLAGGWGGVEGARSADTDVFLWDVATEKPLLHFPSNRCFLVNAVALSADGRLAAVGTNGSEANVFDLRSRQEIYRVEDGDNINAVAFSADSSRLLTGGDAEVVSLWDVRSNPGPTGLFHEPATPALLASFEGHEGTIHSAAFLPDGVHIISAGGTTNQNSRGSGEVRLWNLNTREQEACCRNFHATLNDMAIDAKGDHAIVASFNGELLLLSLNHFDAPLEIDQPSKQLVPAYRTFTGNHYRTDYLSFSPDGKTLLSLGDESTVRLWNVADAREIRNYDFNGAFAAALIPPDQVLAMRSVELETFNINSASPARSTKVLPFGTHREEISSWNIPVFDRGHRALLLGQKRMLIWNLPDNKLVRQIDTPDRVRQALVSPDENSILTVQGDGCIYIDDIATGQQLRQFKTRNESGNTLLFAPDGRSFFCTRDYGDLIVQCDFDTGEELMRFRGHRRGVSALAITADGHFLVSSGYDKTIRVWNVETGEQLHQYDTRRLSVTALAISPDNHSVASNNPDGSVALWRLSTDEPTP